MSEQFLNSMDFDFLSLDPNNDNPISSPAYQSQVDMIEEFLKGMGDDCFLYQPSSNSNLANIDGSKSDEFTLESIATNTNSFSYGNGSTESSPFLISDYQQPSTSSLNDLQAQWTTDSNHTFTSDHSSERLQYSEYNYGIQNDMSYVNYVNVSSPEIGQNQLSQHGHSVEMCGSVSITGSSNYETSACSSPYSLSSSSTSVGGSLDYSIVDFQPAKKSRGRAVKRLKAVDEDDSDERKKDQNKRAARKYREKKKEEEKILEEEESELISHNRKLKKQFKSLKKEVDFLKNLFKHGYGLDSQKN